MRCPVSVFLSVLVFVMFVDLVLSFYFPVIRSRSGVWVILLEDFLIAAVFGIVVGLFHWHAIRSDGKGKL